MNPIVGIGEVLWDVYPDGRKVAGGAPFNFAFHCHQLGHPAVIVSRVGSDDLGRELRERVRELGLSDEYIQTDREHHTGTVQVTLDANKVPTYTITENVAWDYLQWDEQTARAVYVAPAICFGTLVQRTPWSRETLSRLIFNAYGFVGLEKPLEKFSWTSSRDKRPRVIVCDLNIRQHYYDKTVIERSLCDANWCKMNDDELALMVGLFDLDGRDDSSALASLARLNNWGKHVIAVTYGGEGCQVHSRREQLPSNSIGDATIEEETFTEPGVAARVVDTVGAGDAFTAAMVCLHLEGKPLRECARFANHYAARVCEQPGGTPRIDRAEVELEAFGKRPG